MSQPPLPPWRPSDAYNARYQRRLNEAVNAVAAMRGDNGIDVLSEHNGMTAVNTRPRIHTEIVYGKILDTGPLGTEDDMTGNQYWVRRRRIKGTAGVDVTIDDESTGQETRTTELEDDDAPDGDKVATGEGEELRDDTIIIASDPFGTAGGGREYIKDQPVIMLAVDARVPAFDDDGADISGSERAYIIIGIREETVWAALGAYSDHVVVGDDTSALCSERRYSWSRIVGYRQDEDDGGVGNDSAEHDLTSGGTVDENYAVYHFSGSPQIAGMTLAPHLFGRAVLLRRIWREERYYTPHAYFIRRVRAWAIVEPPTPTGISIKTGATYDATSRTQQGFRQFYLTDIVGPPNSTDKSACAAAALGSGAVEVLLVNGYPPPFNQLPSNMYVDATFCYITSDNVQVYRCCVPGLKTATAVTASGSPDTSADFAKGFESA